MSLLTKKGHIHDLLAGEGDVDGDAVVAIAGREGIVGDERGIAILTVDTTIGHLLKGIVTMLCKVKVVAHSAHVLNISDAL